MAAVRSELRTSGLFLLLFLIVYTSAVSPPWIFSVLVNDVACDSQKCAYKLDVKGEFDEWSLTYAPGGPCLADYVAKNGVVEVPNNGNRVFFCAKSAGLWRPQGDRLFLEADDVTARSAERYVFNNLISLLNFKWRKRRFLFKYLIVKLCYLIQLLRLLIVKNTY